MRDSEKHDRRKAWIVEIQKRMDGIRDGSRKTVTWDEARRDVLDRLRAVRG